MSTRAPGRMRARAIRGAIAGTLTALVALTFHVTAGAPVPPLAAILGATAAAIWVCVLIGSARLSLPVLAASIAVAQFVLHWIFAASTGGASLSGGTHAQHADHALEVSGAHAGHAMWQAHTVAGILTLVAIRYGDRALARIHRFAVALLARLVRLAREDAAPPAGPIARAGAFLDVDVLRPRLAASVARRGPPVPQS